MPSPPPPEEAGLAGRGDDLALARVRCVVAGVQRFQEGNDGEEDSVATSIVHSVDIIRSSLLEVLEEFR